MRNSLTPIRRLTGLIFVPVLAYMQGLDVGGVFVHPFCLLGLGNMFEAVMQLAVFPTDKRLVRVFCCFQFGGTLFLTLRMPVLLASVSLANDLMAIPTWWSWLINCIVEVVANCWCFVYLAPTILCDCCCPTKAMTPRASLRRVWVMMRGYFWIVSLSWIEVGIHSLILYAMGDPLMRLRGVDAHLGFTLYGITGQIFAVVATPRNRGRVTRFLGSLGGKGSAEQEAAAVAALVGDLDPSQALETASQRFRALRWTRLHPVDLETNKNVVHGGPSGPKEPLVERSEPCQLGECDVFFSHSWADEEHVPGGKYSALQAWASSFEEKEGREPLIWLDKACIDQDDIDASLACLPIFLSGTRQLLIAAGPTYSGRLWCVVEIFVFLKMGGTRDELTFLQVGEADARSQLGGFDASKAQCFLKRDREKLLAVIEAGFGDLYAFNSMVHGLFPEGKSKTLAKDGTKVVEEVRV